MRSTTGEQGLALVAVLGVTTLLSALALGLAVTLVTERLATDNLADAGQAALVADSGIGIAAAELRRLDDWNGVLDGTEQAALSDDPLGFVTSDGTEFDLEAESNRLTCGRAGGCSAAQRRQVTSERPWGERNPVWQPFLVMPFERVAPSVRGYHLVVWAGDDVLEEDGNVLLDSSDDQPGARVVRLRALAIGPRGTRRSAEATVSRACTPVEGLDECSPSIRVQSWRTVHPLLP